MRLGLLLVALAACTPPAPIATETAITMTPPPPAPRRPEDDPVQAAGILRGYADSHAFGAERRAPNASELAAAAHVAEPIDATSDRERWHALDPAFRLLEVYEQHQRRLWFATCEAAVARWWPAARKLDDELAARLAQQPLPDDLYAGIAAWQAQRQWLDTAQKADPALGELPWLANTGAMFRLFSARHAWAGHFASFEQAVADLGVPRNAWALEDLAVEQARFCTAAYSDGARSFPPASGLRRSITEGIAAPPRPSVEWGALSRIGKHGGEWTVIRREHVQILETVPPCKRVRCTGLDCEMDERHGWRDVCVEKYVPRVETSTYVLELAAAAPPFTPRVGDSLYFFWDQTTHHAVIQTAAHGGDQPKYFVLEP